MVSNSYTRPYDTRGLNRAERMAMRAKNQAKQIAEEHRRKEAENKRLRQMKAKRQRQKIFKFVDGNIGSWRSPWGLFKAAIGQCAERSGIVFCPHPRLARKLGQELPENRQGLITSLNIKGLYTPGGLHYQFCPSDPDQADTLVRNMYKTFEDSGIKFSASNIENSRSWAKYTNSDCTHIFKFTRVFTDLREEFEAYGKRVFGAYPNRGFKARRRYKKFLKSL